MKKRISILSMALLLSGFSVMHIDATRQAIRNNTDHHFTGPNGKGEGWPITYEMTFPNCPGNKGPLTFTRHTGMVFTPNPTNRLAAGQGELGDEWRQPNAGMQITTKVTVLKKGPKHTWTPAGDSRANELIDTPINLASVITQTAEHGAGRTANLWTVTRNANWWTLTDEQRRQSIKDTLENKNTANPEFQINHTTAANNDAAFPGLTFVDVCNRNPGNPACGK
ncbi:MAG: hypothetical protein NT124_00010 [Candidatus Dependentiae bacterium]|nr:hypothetical protein [Candidatus Dependentiae bacterium]